MRTKKKDLDIDVIQSKTLTKEEEKKLSEFIKKRKDKGVKSNSKKIA